MLMISCSAEVEKPSIPEDVLNYAQSVALPEMKTFMKANDYVGTVFDSAEEIDSLRLGEAIPYMGYAGEKLSKGSVVCLDRSWTFVAEGNKGHSVLFYVYRTEEGLSFSGAQNAKNYLDAKEIMQKLMKKAGVEGEPRFIDCFYCSVMYADFNGDERIITVLTDACPLNEKYYSVTDHRELPTLEEFNSAVAKERAKPIVDENGSPIFGSGQIDISPHLSPAYGLGKGTSWPIAVSASAVFVIAGAVGVGVRKRRKKTGE
ncbi:MAG: hypothetical protein IKG85_02475 [Clostridia bacterium]|nr:hypothetical protein [Clostridia bacterium]